MHAVGFHEFQEEKIGEGGLQNLKFFGDESWVQQLTHLVQFVGVHVEFSILFPNQNLLHCELPKIGT